MIKSLMVVGEHPFIIKSKYHYVSVLQNTYHFRTLCLLNQNVFLQNKYKTINFYPTITKVPNILKMFLYKLIKFNIYLSIFGRLNIIATQFLLHSKNI